MSVVEFELAVDRRHVSAVKATKAPVRFRRLRSCSAGFVPRHPRMHWVYNRCIGILLLVLAVPMLVLIGLALFATQGKDILYCGERLGKGRKPFWILKFRTLDSAKAAQITAGQVLPKNSNIETPLGRYLRASRLDELPQILNIVMGDMNIVGPRPVRAAIAVKEEARNPHYAARYRVTPGLVGQTQAFMSHGTDKRVRSKFNYYLCSRPVNYRSEIALFVLVGLSVLSKSAQLLCNQFLGTDAKKRARDTALDWRLVLEAGTQSAPVIGFDGNILTALRPIQQTQARLMIQTRSGGYRAAKVSLNALGTDRQYKIEPVNAFARHCLDRYVSADAVVAPRPAPRHRRHAVRFGWNGISIVKPDLSHQILDA